MEQPARPGDIHSSARIGASVVIRANTVVREDAAIGERSRLGISVYVGPGVIIGQDCKIQNLAQLFEPAFISDGCFIGPAAVLTNDRLPRALNLDHSQKAESDWKKDGVRLGYGVTVGASAVCVGPIELGDWVFVAAGSVVTKSFPAFTLVAGNPGRKIGWVGRSGAKLQRLGEWWVCPQTGEKYIEDPTGLSLFSS